VFRANTSADSFARVLVPARGASGDPTTSGGGGGGALLEIYNAAGTGEKVVIALPASGWFAEDGSPQPGGYRYVAHTRDDPVKRLAVRANHIRLRAGGASFAYTLDEPEQGAIALRLRLGTALPWCASAPAKSGGSPPSTTLYDHVDRFIGARNTPPPAICPPLP